MKLFLTGLAIIGLFILANLLGAQKISSSARGIAITATLLLINVVMMWGVIRKHR